MRGDRQLRGWAGGDRDVPGKGKLRLLSVSRPLNPSEGEKESSRQAKGKKQPSPGLFEAAPPPQGGRSRGEPPSSRTDAVHPLHLDFPGIPRKSTLKPEHVSIAETENPNQPQSALKALQYQLESFQALRTQTLQNVSMVQYEISEILNKSIIEVESPQFGTEKATKKPVEKVTEEQAIRILHKDSENQKTLKESTENTEETLSKEKINLFEESNTTHSEEENSNSVTSNSVSQGVTTPSQVTSKNVSTLKNQTNRSTSSPNMSTLEKSNLLKNCSDFYSFLPYITQNLYSANTAFPIESKSSMPFLKEEFGGNLEDVCHSIKKMKDELQRSHEREMALANELHLLKIATDAQGIGSNIPFLPKLEKVEPIKKENINGELNEDIKSSRISELEALINKLIPLGETMSKFCTNYYQNSQSLSENQPTANLNHSTIQNEVKSEKNNREIPNTDMIKHLQLDSSNPKDTSSLIDQTEREMKDKEKQLFELYQGSLKLENEKSLKINPVTDQYVAKIQYLHNYLKESVEVQKKVLGLENENLDLKTKIKPMVYTIQSLMQKNSTYQNQLEDLVEEKKTIQDKLSKAEEDNKECIIELKRIIQKYSELQNVNKVLEEKNGQLSLEIQCMIELINQLKIKEEKTQSDMVLVNHEVNRLTMELESLTKSNSALQNDKQMLERKACQLQKENSSLEHELKGSHLEILQLKEKERLTKSDQEALLQVIQTTKNEKLNLEATLQESAAARQIIEKEVEKIQSYQCDAKEKFQAELQNAKSKASFFKNGLSEMGKECEKLSKMVKGLQSDNQVLKEELKKHTQENLKFAKNISRLTEDKVLLENYLRTVENERDTLQFEVQRRRDYFTSGKVFSNKHRELTQLTYTKRNEHCHFGD
ncbi:coiled-coil domain-containing protein 110 [Dromiciops gliroides]|uniref:coiled-coil domain-containing protein 110 n=1 Tax=Dromiciops gliroides TaxID=33562 RepID=UPI001CC520CD|nr:coiled-coil domain-containing protein 110 [Dromiciops gliroides]